METQELQSLKNKYGIVGNDAALIRALEMAVAVAPTDLTVLVTGESGTGKENIPKIIHQNSLRKNGKYFAVNCGAIPEGTIDSELFGHEKGSFTGAIEARKGYFEEADGGTLFLDEIGELPLSSQAKLLRVLQSGEYIRVGSSKVGKTDVRVIAATNVDLRYAVAKGKFREDLYYRLNAIQITMPALRDRGEDIYLLFRKFTADFSEKYSMKKVSLTRDAIQILQSYRWPGNIRQLKNIAETVAALESERLTRGADKCEVNGEALSRYIPKDDPNSLPVRFGNGAGASSPLGDDDKNEIYRALYSLKAEIDNLKKIISNGGVPTHTAPTHVLPPSGDELDEGIDIQEEPAKSEKNVERPIYIIPDSESQRSEPQTIESSVEKEPLTIKEREMDMIMKALEKHGGNRKKAAQELGLSERTLYRKLAGTGKNDKEDEQA